MLHDFFPLENRAVYGIKWTNMVERGKPQMTIWPLRIACWIPKATNTHSEFVIFITFLLKNGCTNAPRCYTIRALPVFSKTEDVCRVGLHMQGSIEGC